MSGMNYLSTRGQTKPMSFQDAVNAFPMFPAS